MEIFEIKIDKLKENQIIRHCENVTLFVRYFADLIESLGGNSKRAISAAKIHDVGKLRWERKMFMLPFNQLTSDNLNMIYSHPADGVKILQEAGKKNKEFTTGNPSIYDIIYLHHEKPDGSGYYRIKNIPVESAVLSIADIFNACIAVRPYKGSMPINIAIAEAVNPFRGYFSDHIIKGIAIRLKEIYQIRNKPYDMSIFSKERILRLELSAMVGVKIDLKKYEPLQIM